MTEHSAPNPDYFKSVHDLTLPIHDTNARAAEIPSLNDPEFEAIATEALTLEQQPAFDALVDAMDPAQHDAVTTALQESVDRVAELELELEDVKDSMSAEQRRYDDLVTKLVKIAPLGETQAKELAERKKSEIELQRADDLRTQITAQQAKVAEAEALFESAGQAWPIPVLAKYAVQEQVDDVPTGEDVIIIDEIPIDPALRSSARDHLREISERHVDAPEASKFITLYLSENKGRVVTVDQLCDFLYANVDSESVNLRSRITTILGPRIQGMRIQGMLAEENLLLQYGLRSAVTATGKNVGPKYRIYRALDLEQVDTAVNYITHNGHADSFDNAQPEIESPVIDGPDAIALGATAVQGASLEEAPAEEAPVVDSPEPEAPAPEPKPTPAAMPAKKAAAKKAEPAPEAHVEKVPAPAKKTATKKAAAPKAEKAASKEPLWATKLRKAVGEQMQQLEEDGLMGIDEITLGKASAMSSSAKFGTITALQRLAPTGIIKLPNSRNQYNAYPLTQTVRVVMALFNTHTADFLERPRHRLAMQIVEEAVASYNERHNEE
jgi:hypothetical protein